MLYGTSEKYGVSQKIFEIQISCISSAALPEYPIGAKYVK